MSGSEYRQVRSFTARLKLRTNVGTAEIFSEHRSLLFGIAYRMLGRIAEAKDMVQETWLRWRLQALPEIRPPKAWHMKRASRFFLPP